MSSRRRFDFRTIALATAVLALAGCATGAAFDPQAQPPLRIGQSRIVFYVAKSSVLAHGIRRRLYIDGQAYAEIEPGQYVVVDTAPGLRRVMFRPVRDEANKDVLSFPIDLPVGQVLYGRIFSTGGYYPATFYGVVPEHLAISQMRGMTAIQAGSFAPESPMPSVAARQP